MFNQLFLIFCFSICTLTERDQHNTTSFPTADPSPAPTPAPTRPPTFVLWKSFNMDYNLSNITTNITLQIAAEIDLLGIGEYSLTKVIRTCYIQSSMTMHPNDSLQWLQIGEFTIDVFSVLYNDEENANAYSTNKSILLQSLINYGNNSDGDQIRAISRTEEFRLNCRDRVRAYFNYFGLLFHAHEPLKDIDESITQNFLKSYIWWASAGIAFICWIIAFASFIYNNFVDPNVAWTDNANSYAIMLYGLQLIDLMSDIYVSIEIFSQFDGVFWDPQKAKLYVAGYGNFFFFAIPYIANLIIASGIRKNKIIKNNPFAKSYFQTKMWFYIALVVFVGGVYPPLSMCSSRLFAFDFLNSGLSAMELTKLTQYRFFGTNLLENIPQLCFSLIYTSYRAERGEVLSSSAILSMILSVLQLITSITNYMVNRRATDCIVVEYDLEMMIDERLTEEDKDRIRQKKERKDALRQWICTNLALSPNAIAIGYITLTSIGCIIHVIHYTFEQELVQLRDANVSMETVESDEIEMENAEQSEKVSLKEKNGEIDVDFKTLAKKYCRKLYPECKSNEKQHIDDALAAHFEFDVERVSVKYHQRYRYTNEEMKNRNNFSFVHLDTTDDCHLRNSIGEVEWLINKIKQKLVEDSDENTVIKELVNEGLDEHVITKLKVVGKEITLFKQKQNIA